MTQSPEAIQSKDESSSCGKNHIVLAAGLCLMLLIPLLGVAAVLHISADWKSSNLAPVLFFWSVILFILGLALWESVDLIRKKGLSSCCRKGRIAVTVGLCSIPWGFLFTGYASAPGLVTPVFHNLIVIQYLVPTALWQAVGFILLIRAKSPMRSFLAILFFILPACLMIALFPMLGPAIITLVNAFSLIPVEK